MGTHGDGEKAAGLLATASWGPSQAEFVDVPLHFIHSCLSDNPPTHSDSSDDLHTSALCHVLAEF